MKKQLLLSLTTTLALSTAFTGFASTEHKKLDLSDFYVAAQAGVGSADVVDSQTGFAYRVAAGAFFMKPMPALKLGAEFGYNAYPSYTKTLLSVGTVDISRQFNTHYFDLLAVANYSFTDKVYGIAKLGIASVNQSNKTNEAVGVDSISQTKGKTGVLPEVVMGAGYQLNKNIAFDLTYNHTFGRTVDLAESKNDLASTSSFLAGIRINFG